jgi:pimeloyl-ACP methyl ester carboxylesterase
MNQSLPILLIPCLLGSARLYTAQIPEVWRFGPVTIADHTRNDSISGMAQRILATAPPKFALFGLSLGGYIAFEILRVAPERVIKLGLLDTTARPDLPEQSESRREQIAEAARGRLVEVLTQLFPRWVHPRRRSDDSLRTLIMTMGEEVGTEAFIRQQQAIMGRIDSRASLGSIRCPTLILVGEQDEVTPPDRASEIASAIPGSHLVVVPDCGHMSAIEQPQKVTQAMVEFLAS